MAKKKARKKGSRKGARKGTRKAKGYCVVSKGKKKSAARRKLSCHATKAKAVKAAKGKRKGAKKGTRISVVKKSSLAR